MKFIALVLIFASAPAFAYDTYVNGYTKSNGTYVEGYHRTSPDSSTSNNYSTRGNVNPYTGREGTVSPTYERPTNNYGGSYGNSGTRGNSYNVGDSQNDD